MNDISIINFGVVGTGFGIFAAVNALFFKADDFFSKEFKEDVALWILCIEPRNSQRWSEYFIHLFDWIFKPSVSTELKSADRFSIYLSWHTFARSCIASLLSIMLVFMIGVTTGSLSLYQIDITKDPLENWLLIALLPATINFLPDYLSLLQTRYFLGLAILNQSTLRILSLIVLDIVATVLIIAMVFPLSFFVFNILFIDDGITLIEMYKGLWNNVDKLLWIKNNSVVNIAGVFVLSTFFTSIWIWLFAVSNFFLNAANRTQPSLYFIRYILPLEERPFRSMGIIAGVISMTAYWSVTIF